MAASEINEAFARVRRDRGRRVAVHGLSESRILTFGDLADEADAVAAVLRRHLPTPAIVIALIGNRTAFVSTLLACREAGAIVVPLDGDSTVAEALALVERFHAAAVIGGSATAFDLRGERVDLPNGLALFRSANAEPTVDFPGAALFKLTSGSTAAPKAVIVSEANLIADGQQIVRAMDIRPDDVNLAAIPLSHSYGLGNLIMPLVLQGSPIVLRDAFAPARLFDDIRDCGASVMPGVPFMFDYIRQHLSHAAFPASMRVVITAGARIDPITVSEFKKLFGLKIHSFYGTSETGGIAYDGSDEVSDPLTLGRPLDGVAVTFRALPAGVPGEGRLHVRSAAVAHGYAANRADTQENFVDGGYLTGDVGYTDEAGRIVLTGRVSRFINVAGRKVHPDEVARVLRACPGVSDARVFGVADPARGQALVACVVADPAAVDAIAIRRHCAMKLSPYKIPRRIVVLERLPVDARGKTDHHALEALVNRDG
jgi:long-chain acyl-CoA synthetase